MPELPEVETLVRDLRETVVGKTIVDVHVGQPKGINIPLADFRQRVRGQVSGADRHGKEAILHMPDGELGLHLGLGGSVKFLADAPWPTGGFITFRFAEGGQLSLDRVFMGHAHWRPKNSPREAPDALDPELTEEGFVALLRRKARLAVKAALMDQHVLAGIGNTYSDEVLLRARINPARRVGDLADGELATVYRAMHDVLCEAVAAGGEGDWIDLGGRAGRYPFAVHGVRKCGACGGRIESAQIGSRTANYCPVCQPAALEAGAEGSSHAST